MNYGLKGGTFCKDTSTGRSASAACAKWTLDSDVLITEDQSCTFTLSEYYSGFSDSVRHTSKNVFKKDPGIAGVVTDLSGTPLSGKTVKIHEGDTPKSTVTTDSNGYHQHVFTYNGKPTTFTIKLPEYNVQKSVTIKSNKLVIVTFAVDT